MKYWKQTKRALAALAMGIIEFGVASDAWATEPCTHFSPDPAAARLAEDGGRVALVIGNSAYDPTIGFLPNPANDAQAVTDTLLKLGFTVFRSIDADGDGMKACARAMADEAAGSAVGLVYFSGHGIQLQDQNYLLAIDAKAGDTSTGFVAANDVIEPVQTASQATLVFLDACRNNPLVQDGTQGLSVSTGRGLKAAGSGPAGNGEKYVQPRGLLVAYSTSPNSVALDGNGDLSPFTSAFVRHMATPGHSIQRVMSGITNSVGEETDWSQTPWTRSSLTSELKLYGTQSVEEAVSQSENWARRSDGFLVKGRRLEAMAAALKGLPKGYDGSDPAFSPAQTALYAAYRAVMPRVSFDNTLSGYTVGIVSPDNTRILLMAQMNDGTRPVQVWDGVSGQMIAEIAARNGSDKNTAHGDFTPDGKLLAAGINGGDVLLINAADGTLIKTLPAVRNVHPMPEGSEQIRQIAFDLDGHRLLTSGGNDGQALKIWSVPDGTLIHSIDIAQLAGPLGLGPKDYLGGIIAAFSGSDTLCLAAVINNRDIPAGGRFYLGFYNPKDNTFEKVRQDEDAYAGDGRLFCSADARKLASNYYVGSGYRTFGYNADTGAAFIDNDQGTLFAGGFDPTSSYFASQRSNGEWRYFDLASGTDMASPHPAEYRQASPLVYSSITGDIAAAAWQFRPEALWTDMDRGAVLVSNAMALLSETLRRDVEEQRILGEAAIANASDAQ